MKSFLPLAVAFALAPMAALAMPAEGDILGTTPETATAALAAAGCEVLGFEAEGNKIEAKCKETETGKIWDLYIDPKTGAALKLMSSDD